jgi:hypothetical protein
MSLSCHPVFAGCGLSWLGARGLGCGTPADDFSTILVVNA